MRIYRPGQRARRELFLADAGAGALALNPSAHGLRRTRLLKPETCTRDFERAIPRP